MVTNLLKATPYTKEKFTGQGSRHCGDNQNVSALHPGPAIPPGYSPPISVMASAIESGGIIPFLYMCSKNKAADRRLIPQSRILRGTGNRERARETKHLRKVTTTLPHA